MHTIALFFRLFCSVAGSDPIYFASFDSGDHDQEACQLGSALYSMYLTRSEQKPVKCWCAPAKAQES